MKEEELFNKVWKVIIGLWLIIGFLWILCGLAWSIHWAEDKETHEKISNSIHWTVPTHWVRTQAR